MGLPQINIRFETLGTSAIKRSSRGIVALILKDDTVLNVLSQPTMVFRSIDEVEKEKFTAENYDYIAKTLKGTPSRVIVELIATTDLDYNKALQRLKTKTFNYLSIPGIDKLDTDIIATWIKSCRENDKKTYKAVLPHTKGDSEGIINFTTEEIKVGDKEYSASKYTCRIAGILAGLPFTRSSTYFVLDEVDSIKPYDDPDTAIDSGELILIHDGEKVKIGRGVNSLVTTTAKKNDKFKKIKIIEAIDLMRDDIRSTFADEYTGKVNNTYDDKILFISAINSYFKILQKEDVLDPAMEAKAEIDLEAQAIYLEGDGVKLEELAEQQIKEYNTGSKVFIKAKGSPLDAMEDLDFGMLLT